MPGKKRSSLAEAEEESFPRGGGSGLAPIVHKQIKEDAYREAEADLFSNSGKKQSKKRRKSTKFDSDEEQAQDEEDDFFRSLASQDKIPKYVELLKFRGLNEGTKLWGAVTEILSKELIISLPHGLRGHVALKDASDVLADILQKEQNLSSKSSTKKKTQSKLEPTTLSNLFYVGQLVRCCVTKLRSGLSNDADQPPDHVHSQSKKESKKESKKTADTENQKEKGSSKNKKRIDLSLFVSQVNSGVGRDGVQAGACLPACVKSVEDHGYILTFGIKGTTGFLPKSDVPEERKSTLGPGSLIDVVIQSVKPGGHAIVTAAASAVAGSIVKEWDGLNISTLLPGSLVNAKVQHVLSDGLLVSFLTFFNGTIDPFHLQNGGGKRQGSDWKEQYSENQKIKARILFVDPATKRVGLTLRKHLLNWTLPEAMPSIGQLFTEAVVSRVDPGLGLLVDIPVENDGNTRILGGYAHISNLADQKIDKVEARYRPGQVVGVRVIGTRPMDGLAAVSLKPSVIEQSFVRVGDITIGMKVSGTVVRSEQGHLLIALTPQLKAIVPSQHMSDVVSAKTYKKFKEGQKVNGRVWQVDPATKRVVVTLKPALVESKLPVLARVEDALPGMKSHGVISGLQPYGMYVTFYNDLSGLVPLPECGLPQGQSLNDAFTVGSAIKVRVLGIDPRRKDRIRLSLSSKKKAKENNNENGKGSTDALGGLQPGDMVFGIVSAMHTKKRNTRNTLSLGEQQDTGDGEEGEDDADAQLDYAEVALYHRHSQTTNDNAGDEVTPNSPIAIGRLEVAHLSDHPAAGTALGQSLSVGSKIDSLLVLQRLENAKMLRVTRKDSLIAAVTSQNNNTNEGPHVQLPSSISHLVEGATYFGYIASIAADAVFVRFLGDLTGRSGLPQLSDTFVSDPHAVFSLGQTVRAQVAQIDTAKNRFSVTLKRSLCGGGDASILKSFFLDSELAASWGGDEEDAAQNWSEIFSIGQAIEGQVHGVREYGILCDLAAHSDAVGLIAPNQGAEGGPAAEGAPLVAVVLDYSKKEGIIDLSARKDMLERAVRASSTLHDQPPSRKKAKRVGKKAASKDGDDQDGPSTTTPTVAVGDKLDVTVELLKLDEGYAVVSLPTDISHPWIGYLSLTDYNLSTAMMTSTYSPGDVISATIAALPSADTCGRLLLGIPPERDAPGMKQQKNSKSTIGGGLNKANKALPSAGTITKCTIESIHTLHADVSLNAASSARGRIYITELVDDGGKNPLKSLTVGTTVDVLVLGRMQSAEGKRHGLLELSCRGVSTGSKQLTWDTITQGQTLHGYVQDMDGEYLWVVFTPTIRGRIFLPSVCASIDDASTLTKRFKPGTPLTAVAQSVNISKHALDLSLSTGTSKGTNHHTITGGVGDTVMGVIVSVKGSGVQVQLGNGLSGRVALTEIHDMAVKNALDGLKPKQFVKVAILDQGDDSVSNNKKVTREVGKKSKRDGNTAANNHSDNNKTAVVPFELSLRPSKGGQCIAHSMAEPVVDSTLPPPPDHLSLSGDTGLTSGRKVSGYVKSAGPTGVFICLSRAIDGRVKLRQLSDDFVEDPVAAYPPGRYVEGTVLSVEGGKIELTLRQRVKLAPSLENFEEGQIVHGRVRRVEKFGVFIELDSGRVGLAHVSELSDGFVRDIDKAFKIDQRVRARVLGVDKTANRLSLGLKPGYFEDVDEEGGDGGEHSEGVEDFEDELNDVMMQERPGDQEDDDDDDEEDEDSSDDDKGEEEEEDFDLDEELLEGDDDDGSDV